MINTGAPNACVRYGHSSRTEMASKDPFESPSQDSVAPHRGNEERERTPIRYEREPTEPIAALTALIQESGGPGHRGEVQPRSKNQGHNREVV